MAHEEDGSPWSLIGWGLVMLVGGIAGFFIFWNLEDQGGSVRLPGLLVLAYQLLGKWGVLVIFCGIGGFMTIAGYLRLKEENKS